jgi:plastocyanin
LPWRLLVNLQSSQIVKSFIRAILFTTTFFVHVSVKAWDIDFSRRQKEIENARRPASVEPAGQIIEAPPENKGIIGSMVGLVSEVLSPTQELVIMNTEKGFVPETIRLKKGQNYKFHVVNVNSKQKNISFMIDNFGQHHGTFYGEPKTFSLAPKTEGVFSFVCPETAQQGRIVVYDDRKPASVSAKSGE